MAGYFSNKYHINSSNNFLCHDFLIYFQIWNLFWLSWKSAQLTSVLFKQKSHLQHYYSNMCNFSRWHLRNKIKLKELKYVSSPNINICSRFINDKDFVLSKNCSSQTDQLPLTNTVVIPTFVDLTLQAFGQFWDDIFHLDLTNKIKKNDIWINVFFYKTLNVLKNSGLMWNKFFPSSLTLFACRSCSHFCCCWFKS